MPAVQLAAAGAGPAVRLRRRRQPARLARLPRRRSRRRRIETARAHAAATAPCSPARRALFELAAAPVRQALAAKAVVTPNLAQGAPRPSAPGRPRAVVWASSDKPALTGRGRRSSARCGISAWRTGCGWSASAPSRRRCWRESGLEIEHVGLLSYRGLPRPAARAGARRSWSARSRPAPMPQTQEFVDGKSDVKVIEARLRGLVGVFSRARALCRQRPRRRRSCATTPTRSWLDGLERGAGAAPRPEPAAPWPPHRRAPTRWGRCRGPRRSARAPDADALTLGEVLEAVRFVREQQRDAAGLAASCSTRRTTSGGTRTCGSRWSRASSPPATTITCTSGFREGRAARRRPTPQRRPAFVVGAAAAER